MIWNKKRYHKPKTL